MLSERQSRSLVRALIAEDGAVEVHSLELISNPMAGSQNRIWAAESSRGSCVVKLGDGPLPRRVEREIRVYTGLTAAAHPGLPRIRSAGYWSTARTPYCVMERLEPIASASGASAAAELSLTQMCELFDAFAPLSLTPPDALDQAQLPRVDAPALPLGLSHGGIELNHLGRRADGQLVVFGWADACWAPLGYDLHPLRRHPAVEAILEAFGSALVSCRPTIELPPLRLWLERLREAWPAEQRS